MKAANRFAYFLENKNKFESICILRQLINYDKSKNNIVQAVRGVIPNASEKVYTLEVIENGQAPLGSFLSDILSVNFENNYSKTNSPDHDLPDDIRSLSPWELLTGTDVDIKALYLVRKYIELCIDYPKLYTLGQFQLLLDSLNYEWHLKSLGFFLPIDLGESKQYFYRDVLFRKENLAYNKKDIANRADRYNSIHVLSDLDEIVRDTFLGWVEMNCLQEDGAVEVFTVSDVVDAVLVSLFHLIKEQAPVKKCANCGKLFVPLARSDAIYCDRPAPLDNSKTCKEYGSKVLWYENIKSDEVARLARNIHSAKHMLYKRNPDKPEYKEMFEYFRTEKKKWDKAVETGKQTREAYAEWLRKIKKCKTIAEFKEL